VSCAVGVGRREGAGQRSDFEGGGAGAKKEKCEGGGKRFILGKAGGGGVHAIV